MGKNERKKAYEVFTEVDNHLFDAKPLDLVLPTAGIISFCTAGGAFYSAHNGGYAGAAALAAASALILSGGIWHSKNSVTSSYDILINDMSRPNLYYSDFNLREPNKPKRIPSTDRFYENEKEYYQTIDPRVRASCKVMRKSNLWSGATDKQLLTILQEYSYRKDLINYYHNSNLGSMGVVGNLILQRKLKQHMYDLGNEIITNPRYDRKYASINKYRKAENKQKFNEILCEIKTR